MRCEICRKDPETIVLLPLKQPDGRYNTFACMECSLESGHYCGKHDRPNLGFEDGTSACIKCVEEIVESDGEKIVAVFAVRAGESSNFSQVQEVVEDYLEGINLALAGATFVDLSLLRQVDLSKNASNIARPIITYSLRKGIDVEEAVRKAVLKPEVVFLGIQVEES